MSQLRKFTLDQGLALNQRLSGGVANGLDWLFKRDTLIQSGRTWFELVDDGDLMAVRYYELPDEEEIELADGTKMPIRRQRHRVPLVLVLPLAVTSDVFDLLPQRSLVRYLVAAGYRVYLIDWGNPGKQHARLGLSDYSYTMMNRALSRIRRHSGERELSLMGWCMGGLLCLLHQGQVQDPDIRNIVTVASPIDIDSGSGVIADLSGVAQALDGPAQLVKNYVNISANTLDPERFSVPGWVNTIGFKMTDPVGSVTTYFDLVTRLWDREFVESHTTTSNYLNNMLRYPGGVMKDLSLDVMGDNKLAREGKVQVGERVAELDKIESNLLAFAGKSDNLVHPDIARKSIDLVASSDREFRVAPGGHMGVIIGSRAQGTTWSQTAEWLATRSD